MILQSAVVGIAVTTAGGDTTIVAGVSGKRIHVFRLILTYHSGTAPVITIKDGASTALSGAMDFPATAGQGLTFADIPFGEAPPWFVCSAGNNFVINVAAAANLNGYVQYAII